MKTGLKVNVVSVINVTVVSVLDRSLLITFGSQRTVVLADEPGTQTHDDS